MVEIIFAVVLVIVLAIPAIVMFRPANFHTLTDYQRLAVFARTGRLNSIKGPGLVYVWPWQTASRDSSFDLRDNVVRLDNQHCITSDNSIVTVDPVVIYKIEDPRKTIMEITNPEDGIISATNTTLRATVGSMTLTDVITSREWIANQMSARMAEQADRWGISLVSVEIQDLRPGPAVEKAMTDRRAAEESVEAARMTTVITAQARREAEESENEALRARAQMEREEMISKAEARRQAMIAQAEGEQDAQKLRTEGAEAFYGMLTQLGPGVEVALRYEQIQALKSLGESPNAKLVIAPSNLTQMNGVRDIAFVEHLVSEDPVLAPPHPILDG